MYLTEIIVATIIAYLFGSISSAIIVCKMMGLPDPRTQGSRNPGATNVLRIGGKKAAAITLLGDMLKGVIPVLAAKLYGLDSLGLALVTFAAFIGHLYPIFFRFEGGKGVATFLGCLLVLSWPTAICWFISWLILMLLTRYVSVGSMGASLLAPLYLWFIDRDIILVVALFAMALILIFRHRSNIAHIIAGTEGKIKKRR